MKFFLICLFSIGLHTAWAQGRVVFWESWEEGTLVVCLPTSKMKLRALQERLHRARSAQSQAYWQQKITETRTHDANLSTALVTAFNLHYKGNLRYVEAHNLLALRQGRCEGLLLDGNRKIVTEACPKPLFICSYRLADASYPYATLRIEALEGSLPKGFPSVVALRETILFLDLRAQLDKALPRWNRQLEAFNKKY